MLLFYLEFSYFNRFSKIHISSQSLLLAWCSLVACLLWDYGAVFTVLSEEPHKHWLFQPFDFNILGFDHNFAHNYRLFLSVTFVPSVTDLHKVLLCRGVAQFGRVPGLGPGCRRFKSCRPDHTGA